MYNNIWLKKGDELGRFEMGSTIVMFFEKDMVEITCKKNKSIRFADKIVVLPSNMKWEIDKIENNG